MNKRGEEIEWTDADEAAADEAAAELASAKESPEERAGLEGVNRSVAEIERYLQEHAETPPDQHTREG